MPTLTEAQLSAAEPEVTNARPPVWRRWQLWVGLAMVGIAVYTLRGRIPDVSDIGAALRTADLRWVWAAAAAEAASMAMFARQQRALLSALDVTMSLPRAIAVTYARSAIAISMPAGSAVSAGFAFQQYRRSGASREHAAATMVLSGLISFFGLAALYAVGGLAFLLVTPSATWHGHGALLLTVAAGVLLGAVIAFAAWRRGRSSGGTPRSSAKQSHAVSRRPGEASAATASVGLASPTTGGASPRDTARVAGLGGPVHMAVAAGVGPDAVAGDRLARGPATGGTTRTTAGDREAGRTSVAVMHVPVSAEVAAAGLSLAVLASPEPRPMEAGPVARRMAALRAAASQSVTAWRTLQPRHWMAAGLFAVANWLLDLLCLAASARAFNLPVGLAALAGIYVGVQLVRQIPLTPGGIGLIETGLLAGLAAANAPAAHAAAAVLTYRVLSCWLIIPIGGLAVLGLRRTA